MKKFTHTLRRALAGCLCAAMVLLSMISPTDCHAATLAETGEDAQDSTPIGGEGSGLINILLIGQDRREESLARSDCMILCSFHPESKKITITSFLRDLYVEIPDHDSNRLNAAYALGGMDLLKQTIQENFNLYLDGCIEADFSHFPQIIDALGGVTIELRQDEAETINAAVSGTLTAGSQLLSGSQALAYSRIRNLDDDGDFSRTLRQRKLLSSLLSSYRNADLLTILSAVIDTLPMISTDLSKRQILVLTAKLFPMLDHPSLVSQRIPADGSYSFDTIRNMEVLTADMESLRRQLRESLLPLPEKTT